MHKLGDMPTDDAPALIGSAAAAAILRIDRSTLSRWVAAGRINPAMELEGRTGARLFRRSDVEALATETTDEGAA